MNTIEIPDRKIKKTYPASWPEMTNAQFECVMQNWLKVIDGKINQYEFLVIVLYNFLEIELTPFQILKEKRLSKQLLEDKYANMWQLAQTLSWLFHEEDNDKGRVAILNYYEVTNRFPEIENDTGISLVGPADGIIDITFGEYRRALDYFEQYGKWRREADLNKFIATIYRPEKENIEEIKFTPGFDGNRKEEFNPNLTEHYAGLLTDIPFWKKYTIWLWFFNCDRYIKEEELELAGKPISFEPLFKRKKNTDDDDSETLDENDLGLTSLLYMIAESKLFGPVEEVDKTGYIDILTALLYWKQQADKIKHP